MKLRILPACNEFDTIKVTSEGGADSLSTAEADALVEARELFGCTKAWEWFRHTTGGNLKAGGWVGVITIGNAQVTVLPKIDHDGGQVSLTRMLVGAGWIDAKFDGENELLEDAGPDLLRILARLYGRQLAKEFSRGLPRRYVECADDLSSLRGRLNLNRQVHLLAACSGKLACEYDNFDYDTPINQILKAGLTRAICLVTDPKLRLKLRTLRNQMDIVSDVPVNPSCIDLINLGRNESRLAPLLSLAKILLTSKAPHFEGKNRGARCFGLMFSMWLLFEQYALNRLGMEIRKTSKPDDERYARGQVSDKYLARVARKRHNKDANVFKVKPDIIVYRKSGIETEIMLIADTKWKNLEGLESKKKRSRGIDQDDAYQMYAYSNLYADKKSGPVRVALLYPVIGDESGTLPGQSTCDNPLSALGEPTDTFILDPKDLPDGSCSGIILDKYDFPLPRRRLSDLPR